MVGPPPRPHDEEAPRLHWWYAQRRRTNRRSSRHVRRERWLRLTGFMAAFMALFTGAMFVVELVLEPVTGRSRW
jgi:hypothetical protein